ncbi:uncharacterized protein SPSK_01996 [Sporothrix schenckii 1099-18]|uniref:Uncharacterized protein n=1 Tax=Sporothrix schenckii 1099-18 TaxID=1397361 RepID=A0A0F2MEV2_SPOSC|nr:uncharacterized protein SPSK_01996 [Sporothrix schenckii 1099-18]KJR87380.1 hypothetical protein SPSK_01996 [Sporothrix schenckii 1099-18]
MSASTLTDAQRSVRRVTDLSRSAPPSYHGICPENAAFSSPLSSVSPLTPTDGEVVTSACWLPFDVVSDDDSDYNGIHDVGQSLDFHIDCNSYGATSTPAALETATIAATSLYGDELTIALSNGDASTVRGVVVPAHPLMDLSNFLGLRSAAPPRSIVTQDRAASPSAKPLVAGPVTLQTMLA